jgi:hypothetical protein
MPAYNLLIVFVLRFQMQPAVYAFKTLISSDNLPTPVLALAGPSILRLFAEPDLQRFIAKTLDVTPLRAKTRQAMGLPAESPAEGLR